MSKISDLILAENEASKQRGNFKPYWKALLMFPEQEQDKKSQKFIARLRIRFLVDFEEGYALHWHKNFNDKSYAQEGAPFERSVDMPCWKEYGLDCPYCASEDKKTRNRARLYIWPVWDYEANEVKLLAYRNNPKTLTGKAVSYFEEKGTIVGRDFIAKKVSATKGAIDTDYDLLPEDPSAFQFEKKIKIPTAAQVKAALALAKDPELAEAKGYGEDDGFMKFETLEDMVEKDEKALTATKPKSRAARAKPSPKPINGNEDEDEEIDAFLFEEEE